MPQSGSSPTSPPTCARRCCCGRRKSTPAAACSGGASNCSCSTTARSPATTGKLYEQLILEHKADLLIGPLGSAATLGAAAVAERNRRVLVNATGAARAVHKSGFRYVFQSATPLAAYGAGALELARSLGLKRVMLLARDDPGVARNGGARARGGAGAGTGRRRRRGLSRRAPTISRRRWRARAPPAPRRWIAFGLPQDAAEMVKNLPQARISRRACSSRRARPIPISSSASARTPNTPIGIVALRARARHARQRGVRRRPTRRSGPPSPALLAAEGYAAAKVLEEAVRRAGSFDQEKLREALAALETETPLGAYKVDRVGRAGRGAAAAAADASRGRREIVWPEALATAKWQPYPAWDARKPLK